MRSRAIAGETLHLPDHAVSMSPAAMDDSMTEPSLPATLLHLLRPRLPQMLSLLRAFVSVESPSLEKSAADRCSRNDTPFRPALD